VTSPEPLRGEIWLVDWSPGRGSEQSGVRPALIIQNNVGNTYSTTTAAGLGRVGDEEGKGGGGHKLPPLAYPLSPLS